MDDNSVFIKTKSNIVLSGIKSRQVFVSLFRKNINYLLIAIDMEI